MRRLVYNLNNRLETIVLFASFAKARWLFRFLYINSLNPVECRDCMIRYRYKKMKNKFFFLLAGWMALPAFSQIYIAGDSAMEKAIIQSGVIHRPLPLDDTRSYEANGFKKKVLSRRPFGRPCRMDTFRFGTINLFNRKNRFGTKQPESGISHIYRSSGDRTARRSGLRYIWPLPDSKRRRGRKLGKIQQDSIFRLSRL